MNGNGVRREKWKFAYKADDLARGAKKKLQYHQGRLSFWQNAKKSTIDKIRSEGLEVDESLASQLYSNAGRGAAINVDQKLMRDLQESDAKVREHEQHCQDYDGWVQLLDAQGKKELLLNQHDWLFFFGGGSAQRD